MFGKVSRTGFMVFVAVSMAAVSLIVRGVTWTNLTGSVEAAGDMRRLQAKLMEVVAAVRDAETGQQAYQNSGDEAWLDRFVRAERAMPLLLQELETLDRQRRISREERKALTDAVESLLASMHGQVEVRRREGAARGLEVLLGSTVKTLAERVTDLESDLENRLKKAAAGLERRVAWELRWGLVSSLTTGAVALGSGIAALLLYRDSIRQYRREAQLARAKLEAEKSDEQKSAFLATMSHEIRTPMNAILGFGELLETEVKTETEKRYVKSILAGGRSLLQLINDILDLSKIEAGMMDMHEVPTDLAELAHFIRQLFAEQAARKGLELSIVLTPDLPDSLLLDVVRVRQILLNVVGNALKFTERGYVRVTMGGGPSTGRDPAWRLRLEVEDSGVGIPADRVVDIFRPFVQSGRRSAAEEPGTGLGLAIVKRLTHLMGGTVTVDSTPGQGSVFRFEFPNVRVARPSAQPAEESDAVVDFNDLPPSKLLLADDNPMNRELVRSIFRHTHHTLRLTANGREAVEAIAAEPPDVVLMDIRMPGMDGREALNVVRSREGSARLPVIAVTASSLADDEAELRRSFDGYVRKPFSRAELYRELAPFLARHAKGGEGADLSGKTSPAVPSPASPESIAEWGKLVEWLRGLEVKVWPGVRDGMSFVEVEAFAAQLAAAAEKAGCPPLAEYAGQLHEQGRSFSVGSLERSLERFPEMISAIEQCSVM
ncbi:MAG: hypothetical protein JWL81_556 [Verrucomicrobiales bacterium]|nr:hypothetical protein [Verrucomicrobiales bacterium]